MRGAKIIPVVLGALALLVTGTGCGDNGNGEGAKASDFEGLWLIVSMTIEEEETPTTYTRDGDPRALRGDVEFEALGQVTGSLDVRQAELVEGVLVSPVHTDQLSVTIEAGHWVIENQGNTEVSVFLTTLADDRLTLAYDADDPRNTNPDQPQEVVVERASPWGSQSVGSWQLVSMTLPDGSEITPQTCVPAGEDNYMKMNMTVEMSERLIFERPMTIQNYSDAACSQEEGASGQVQRGLAEEEGDTLRIWVLEDDNGDGEYLEFTLAADGDTLNLTRTSCLPTPSCEEAPPKVQLTRQSR